MSSRRLLGHCEWHGQPFGARTGRGTPFHQSGANYCDGERIIQPDGTVLFRHGDIVEDTLSDDAPGLENACGHCGAAEALANSDVCGACEQVIMGDSQGAMMDVGEEH